MKRKNQARYRVCKAPRVVPTDLTPTASILDLDDMIVTIMRWGRPHRAAFVMACQMRAARITPNEARRKFYDGLSGCNERRADRTPAPTQIRSDSSSS